jgi:predicted neutral ceramidase superfamily lipid hydrolase
MTKLFEICIQAFLLVFPPFFVGFFTVPLTNDLAGGNALIQNCYLAGLRLIWTIFVLAFSKDIINFVKLFINKF